MGIPVSASQGGWEGLLSPYLAHHTLCKTTVLLSTPPFFSVQKNGILKTYQTIMKYNFMNNLYKFSSFLEIMKKTIPGLTF